MNTDFDEIENLRRLLLQRVKERLPELEKLLASSEERSGVEDAFYRFYHQSFKVYYAQRHTERIVATFRDLLPERPVNSWFQTIVAEGTGKTFDIGHNQNWLPQTRTILEALFHAQYFLKLMCECGKTLEGAPSPLPSGWAAVLYLYDLR
jgi:hypothetical protein